MQGVAKTCEEMEELGRSTAQGIVTGSVIGLIGELGAGKTHWTKGFAAGLGATVEVTSPTFGLINEYSGGRLCVFHFDFYRLETAQEVIALGWDEYLDAGGVIVAEWADKFPEIMPENTKWLVFSVQEDGARQISEVSA